MLHLSEGRKSTSISQNFSALEISSFLMYLFIQEYLYQCGFIDIYVIF